MDESTIARLCDGLTGAASAAAFAAIVAGHLLGFLLCVAVGFGAQVIRSYQ